ncbi:extracellular solute-binding protein [Pullulanibacillus sp. KACC 23026]|uniref:extracellular solute-binding protein n=1 Tax=Pullulanibacillus sp. KACC 23026 TaxID=3028315 RepID=UPI0023AF685C|nr:extracellular solute-binding protein [Pullulanibacillus sp. KACC 23026]WEG13700.1 extracellular solute-binding protein [Pullulanibacillus sp. KACC 23026]
MNNGSAKTQKILAIMFSSVLTLGVLGGCGPSEATSNSSNAASLNSGPMKLSIMMPSFDPDLATDDSPVVKKLDKNTNTDIHLQWVPSDSYQDKFNVMLASGNLPDIMVVADQTNPAFVKAAEAGQFWDVGPYLKDYKNLSQLSSVVKQNASINGHLYGVPRLRPLGRNGVAIRKDWLNNLGLQEPKTIDDFYNVLKAFKNGDPDKDGKNDTYGLTVFQDTGAWTDMEAWFGVPNQWGKTADGSLKPYFEFPQYQTALDFFKKLYDERLINQDFAALPGSKALDDIESGKSGVDVGVIDDAHRIELALDQKVYGTNATIEQQEKKTYMTALGGVAGPDGLKIMPTSGLAGLLAIPKTSVKTVTQLKQVLKFLDELNDKDNQVLLYNGIEGQQYTLQDGYAVFSTDQKKMKQIHDINQMQMFLPKDESIQLYQTPLRKKENQIEIDDEQIVVVNPAAGLISQTYQQRGAQLDQIINDAMIQYISGQIDKSGLQDAVKQWKVQGGDQVVKEINDLYQKEQN